MKENVRLFIPVLDKRHFHWIELTVDIKCKVCMLLLVDYGNMWIFN